MGQLDVNDGGGGQVPAALSRLVGRERELDEIVRLVAGVRLLTIAGVGGCGKTRLAQAVGERCRDAFPGGVWWVELGSLSGDGLVAGVVATVLDAPQSPGEQPAARIVRHLGQSEALVVLDNCEHLVDECAVLVEQLLRHCPGLKILATSREVIAVPGEQVFRLQGLDTSAPQPDGMGGGAIALFVERAAATVTGFDPGADDIRTLARLCDRLDGLPLAIEVAAARAGVLSITDIAARFEADPRLLRHPSRTVPARHQTLDAALEWSYELLTPVEQLLFARLAPFQGSFSLLAAEAVGAGGAIERKDVLSLLSSLIDKSLVQVADRGPEHRYRLLQTVRQYAESRLADSPEDCSVHEAHAHFYVGLAAQAHAGLEGPDQMRWLQRLDLEHDNLRTVLQRSLPGDPETGGRLAASLWPFWYRRGYYHEARAWLEQTSALTGTMSPGVAAETLTGAGVLAFLQCDYDVATERLRRALDLHEAGQRRVGVATALQRLGCISREQGRYDDARRLHDASRAVWDELGDPAGVAASDDYLGFVAWLEGDFERAEEQGIRALSYFEASGRSQEMAAALVNLGAAARYRGDDDLATERLARALTISRAIGYLEGIAWALHELGAITVGRDPSAGAMLSESLQLHAQLGDRWRIASVVETIAACVLAGGDPTSAAGLLASAHSVRQEIGAPIPPAERPLAEQAEHALRSTLGEAGFARAWAAGLAMPLDRAVELATVAVERSGSTDLVEPATARPTGAGMPADLTDREVSVLRLVSKGLTNREIGRELFISAGTAGVHVSNILRKLGVTSRVQAAGVAHRLGLDT